MDISKLDAAKRQLDTAINLYFKNADPISIHTLTAAAHQILMDLAKLEGIKSIFKDTVLDIIVKDYEREYLSIISEAENFFKHAERDPRGLLKFNPEQTEFLLFDAVEMYIQVTKETPEDISIYRVWFLLKNPNIINNEIKMKLMKKGLDYTRYAKITNKQEFYNNVKTGLMSC